MHSHHFHALITNLPLKIEFDAKKFETLREMMSTKEFVEQYDRGIS